MKQQIIKQLKSCTTQDEVDQVIRKHPIIFAEDYKLNEVAYDVRYEIERKRIENAKTTSK